MSTSSPRTVHLGNVRVPRSHSPELDACSLLLEGDRIAAILPAAAPAPTGANAIEGYGRIALPGFIDAHSHAEGALGVADAELGHLRQGVTTAIIGQDGISFAPVAGASLPQIGRYFAAINGPVPTGITGTTGIAEALATLTAEASCNAAMLVPCGTVRAGIAGFSAAPLDHAQLDRATAIAREAIAEGAVGLSLGLEYVPNGFADHAELDRYASVAAEYGVPLVAHIRGYEADAPAGIGELVGLAQRTGAPVHISHLHGPAELILPHIDAAIAAGVDLTFDAYPYRRGNTILAMLTLPAALQQTGPDGTLAALTSAATRADLERDWFPSIAELLSRLTITLAAHPDWRWVEGLPLLEAAERAALTPGGFVCALLAATDLAAGAIVQQPAANRVADLRAIANHEAHLGGSDGVFLGSNPHPRGWGSFARVLRRHVIEWQDWSWSDAIEHLSARAARRFGLPDRGSLTVGGIADIALLDPASLTDRASYADPRAPATGIMDVLVSGTPVLADGRMTAHRPGHGIRGTRRSASR